MKTFFTTAVTVLAVLILASGGLLVTHAATPPADQGHHGNPSSQALNIGLGGLVLDSGTQQYVLAQNGRASEVILDGAPLYLASSHLSYSLTATESGLSATGSVSFDLSGNSPSGIRTDISATNVVINGMVPAVCISQTTGPAPPGPNGCTFGDSAVPAFFTGLATITVTTSGPSSQQSSQTFPGVPMIFESPYLNPFGGPIIIATEDALTSSCPLTNGCPLLTIVTTYNQATIDWSGVMMGGSFEGTIGSTAVSGQFMQWSQEHENLVSGVAQDSGIMTFASSYPGLNAVGTYSGISLTPHSPSYACVTTGGTLGTCSNSDCSNSLGLPGMGVCTNTGFESQGSFNLQGQGSIVRGSYSTAWSVPAFAFEGGAMGNVYTQPS